MSAVSEVNDIIRTVEEHWIAVTPGYPCECGHLHHGRQLAHGGLLEQCLAPQYNFCDNAVCGCMSLRRKLG